MSLAANDYASLHVNMYLPFLKRYIQSLKYFNKINTSHLKKKPKLHVKRNACNEDCELPVSCQRFGTVALTDWSGRSDTVEQYGNFGVIVSWWYFKFVKLFVTHPSGFHPYKFYGHTFFCSIFPCRFMPLNLILSFAVILIGFQLGVKINAHIMTPSLTRNLSIVL